MTPNFSQKELACKCGCGMLPQQEFAMKLQKLRNMVGFPLPITSAARCPAYNRKVSETGDGGPHTTGRAVDIAISRGQAFFVIAAAIELGFTGIGVSQKGSSRFIHLDDLPEAPGRPRPTIWSY